MEQTNRYNKLKDRHVLVFGGSSGIGLAVAQLSLAHGAKVTISSSSDERIAKAVSALKGEFPNGVVAGIPCDLSSPDLENRLIALFTTATELHGSLNHIIFTASAQAQTMPLKDITAEIVVQQAQFRLVAPIIVAKVAPGYLPREAESSFTLTTGLAKDRPAPGWIVRGTIVGGVESMTRQLALDLAPIRVNNVCPGIVDTPMLDKMLPEDAKARFLKAHAAKMLTGRVATPETVAEAYIYVMKDWNATGGTIYSHSGALLV